MESLLFQMRHWGQGQRGVQAYAFEKFRDLQALMDNIASNCHRYAYQPLPRF